MPKIRKGGVRGGDSSVPWASIYFFQTRHQKEFFLCVCRLGGHEVGGWSWDMWFCEELLGHILCRESTLETDQEKKLDITYLGKKS